MDLIEGVVPSPYSALLYGPPGIGKSFFAAQADSAAFLDIEKGTLKLNVRRVHPHTMQDLFRAMIALSQNDTVKTVIIDSSTAVEKLLVSAILTEHNKKNLEDFGYGKGYEMLKATWQRVLNGIDALKAANRNVILIGHTRVKSFNDPMFEAYDRFEPDIHKNSLPMVTAAMDAVLFFRPRTMVRESEDGKRTMGIGNGGRELYTEERPSFIAKNRFGLEASLLNPDATFWERIAAQ